jgi:hypothetical protein
MDQGRNELMQLLLARRDQAGPEPGNEERWLTYQLSQFGKICLLL